MKDMYILGIESSCDETSASIVKNGTEEIATVISSQIDVHKDFGGVVPEIASRHHVKNVTMVLEECLEKANMTMDDIDAVAITYVHCPSKSFAMLFSFTLFFVPTPITL